MTTHATTGDLCTDDCRHLCDACDNGYHPIAGVIACHNQEES